MVRREDLRGISLVPGVVNGEESPDAIGTERTAPAPADRLRCERVFAGTDAVPRRRTDCTQLPAVHRRFHQVLAAKLRDRRLTLPAGQMEEYGVARWLFKEEPEHYSFAELQSDGKTVWDGISNNLALRNLRQVRRGDRVFFYHTGKEKAVVGEMRVVADPQTKADDPTDVSVEVEAVRALPNPVTLAEIKADAALAGWDLVRLPRLSVLPVTDAQWRRVEELSRGK
jgi:predicted RNA-binding protein with PUA-like domain